MIGVTVAGLMVYHCGVANRSFYQFRDHPYPAIPEAIAELGCGQCDGKPQRVFSVAPLRSPSQGYATSLMLNFPTVYGILACQGYDPLVEKTPENLAVTQCFREDPVAACRAYAVQWIVVHRLVERPEFGSNPDMAALERVGRDHEHFLTKVLPHTTQVWSEGDLEVRALKEARAMAYGSDDPNRALDVTMDARGARIHLDGAERAREVVVAVLARPMLRAACDGQEAEIVADRWGRATVSVPPGTQTLELSYAPPWKRGFLAGSVLLAVAAAMSIALRRRERRRSAAEAEPAAASVLPAPLASPSRQRRAA